MKRLVVTALAALAATPVAAQDVSEDWDLTVDPAQQLTLASLNFGDNALALRCKGGELELFLTGVPATTERFRTVQIVAPGVAEETQVWRTQPGLPVVSASMPDRLARLLRSGGDLDIRLQPATTGERRLRYRLPVPASAASIDQVLSACGERLADEWDLRARASQLVTWRHQTAPEYPSAAVMRDIPLATVRVACVVPPDGRLEECRVLSEAPDGLGFGRAALVAARNSTIDLPENDLSDVGKVAQYTVRFRAPTN